MSEKYLAGFIDADGYISIRSRKGSKPDMEVSVSQRSDFTGPLYEAKEMFGGVIREKMNGKYVELQLRCGPAVKCVERLKKYMVVKKHQAERYLEMLASSSILHTDSEVLEYRMKVKAVKRELNQTNCNYPSRKWMAGYIDGDGCFAAKVCKKTGYAYPFLAILSADNYTPGILLLQKAFGGKIHKSGKNFIWQVRLSQPSKAKKVLGYCMKHLQKKQDIARFIYECANGGNFRDGEAIQAMIITLNSQQHRLSDSTVTGKGFAQQVRFDIQKKKVGRPVGVKEAKPRQKRQSNPLNHFMGCRETA